MKKYATLSFLSVVLLVASVVYFPGILGQSNGVKIASDGDSTPQVQDESEQNEINSKMIQDCNDMPERAAVSVTMNHTSSEKRQGAVTIIDVITINVTYYSDNITSTIKKPDNLLVDTVTNGKKINNRTIRSINRRPTEVFYTYNLTYGIDDTYGGRTSWALVETPKILVSKNSTPCDSIVFHPNNKENVSLMSTNDSVKYSPNMLYYGSVREDVSKVFRKQGQNKKVRVVVTNETDYNYGASPEKQFEQYSLVEEFNWSEDYHHATSFMIESHEYGGVTDGGDRYGHRSFYVDTSKELYSVIGNVYIHEYMHTKQQFETEKSMHWFVEASATYYSHILPYNTYDNITKSDVVSELHLWNFTNSTLSNPDEWNDRRVPYRKGGKVLAHIDSELQEQTNGRATLQDIFAWMNDYNGEITYDVFKEKLEIVSGESFDWLDSMVLEERTVSLSEEDIVEDI